MATKPKSDIVDIETDEPKRSLHPSQLFNDPAPEPEDIALMNVISEIGGNDDTAKINVYRADINKGNKGGAFLFSCVPEEFSLEKLRDEYGGGSYRVHVRAGGGIMANKLVTVEEPKRLPVPAISQPQQSDVGNEMLIKMLETMQNGFNSLGTLILQANQSQKTDPAQMQRDMLQNMVLMKELIGGGNNQPQNNSIELIMKGIELAKDIKQSPAEGPDVFMKLLDTFGGPIAEAVAVGMQQKAQNANLNMPPPPVFQAPTPQPQLELDPFTIAPLPSSNESDNVNIVQKQMLSQYLNFLISQAERNNDVYTYANLILDQAPDDLLDLIDNPQWFDMLSAINPKIKTVEAWFKELHSAIKELTTPEGDDISKALQPSPSPDDIQPPSS